MAEKFVRGSPLTPVELKESNDENRMWGLTLMKRLQKLEGENRKLKLDLRPVKEQMTIIKQTGPGSEGGKRN